MVYSCSFLGQKPFESLVLTLLAFGAPVCGQRPLGQPPAHRECQSTSSGWSASPQLCSTADHETLPAMPNPPAAWCLSTHPDLHGGITSSHLADPQVVLHSELSMHGAHEEPGRTASQGPTNHSDSAEPLTQVCECK